MAYFTRPAATFGASFARPNSSASTVTLQVPNAYDSRKLYPLVLALHSYGSDGADMLTRSKMIDALAFDNGALVLSPNGQTSVASSPNKFWNYWDNTGTDNDFLYLKSLIDAVIATYPVDTTRIYAVCYSNGAFMAHQLSIQYPTLFNAGFTMCGLAGVNDSTATASVPTPWVHFHGSADTTVPPAGDAAGGLPGVLNTHGGVGSVGYKSAALTAAEHNSRNGGAGSLAAAYDTIDFVTAGTPAGTGAETARQAYSGTTTGTAVELWIANGFDHTLTLSANKGEVVYQWLQDHHRIPATTGTAASRFKAAFCHVRRSSAP